MTLLIVDDDPAVSRSVADMIEHLGHRAVVCGNAQDALARLHDGKYDLLLVDYRMPELTGLDLVTLLREEGCQVPVVMMTGYGATEDRILTEKISIAGILRKPIQAALLAKAIDGCLGLPHAG